MVAQTKELEKTYLSGNLEEDIKLFKNILNKDATLRFKRIRVRRQEQIECALMYIDGMVDSNQLNEGVVEPLIIVNVENSSESLAEYIEKQILFARDVKVKKNVAEILQGIMYGEAALLIDESAEAVLVDAKGFKTRGISEPQDERILQGPREGFEEAALLNLAMIRRKLQTPDLCFEMLRVGRRSDTMVYICYLDSLADEKQITALKKRIEKIDIDGILDSNYIAENIRDHRFSVFKTCGTTERPDVVAARLLEGRIALVVDGTPVVLTIPFLFSENFQSDEDYYLNFFVASIGRVLRFVSFFLATSIPAIFIALSSFHRELLPTGLVISVSALRGGVPFSPLTECLILIFIFEILKETGVRMPQSLGHALSIVGGLVVGQAAVEARIISTPMLIIIALSGIAGLMIPRLKGAVFYLRLIFVFSAALFGLFGFFVAATVTLGHILSLKSFGVDYTISLNKANFQSLKDTFFRAPWQYMIKRPDFNQNIIRKGKKGK